MAVVAFVMFGNFCWPFWYILAYIVGVGKGWFCGGVIWVKALEARWGKGYCWFSTFVTIAILSMVSTVYGCSKPNTFS